VDTGLRLKPQPDHRILMVKTSGRRHAECAMLRILQLLGI
jgi:hypothetical protein